MSGLEEIREREQRASDEIANLCAKYQWRISIPANPERDSDLILAASLADIAALTTAVEGVLAVHQPHDAVMYSGAHQRMVQVCAGCGTDDGNWNHYPCATVKAITTALDSRP